MPAPTVGRITSRAAFAQLQRSRARATSGPVRATFVPAPPSDGGVAGGAVYPQVGYAIGRNVGNAVVRNTLRRRARAAIREVAEGLPRGSYLLRIEPAAVRRDRAELAANVREALMRAGRVVGSDSSGSRVGAT